MRWKASIAFLSGHSNFSYLALLVGCCRWDDLLFAHIHKTTSIHRPFLYSIKTTYQIQMLSERATIRSSRSGEGKTKPVQQVKTTKSTLRPSRRGNTLKWMIFIVAILWLAFMFGMLIGILKNDISLKREATPSKGITLPKAPTLKRGKGTPRNIPRDSLRRPSITNDNEVTVPEGGIVDKPNLLPLSENPDAYRSPLLIFTCRRQQYLSQTLDDILENIGDHCAFGCPVVVSEDGKDGRVDLLFKDSFYGCSPFCFRSY